MNIKIILLRIKNKFLKIKNKFLFKFIIFYLIIEFYYYIRYRIQLNYFQKIKPEHKRLSENKINWIVNQIKFIKNKDILLKNLCKPPSDKVKINALIIKKYVTKNILFTEDLDTYQKGIIDNFNNTFKENIYIDNSENVRSVEINNDELLTIYKPFLYYTSISFIKKIYNYYLYYNGYDIDKTNKIEIFYKINKPDFKVKGNLLILHGLGLGVVQNNLFTEKLFSDYNIIMPEIPNLSNSNYCSDCLNMEEICDDIINFINKKNINNIILIGHSFGTAIINYFCNISNLKIKIEKTIYLEPICFFQSCQKTYETAYTENFKWNKDKNLLFNLHKLIIYYYLSRDIYVQALFKRYLLPTDVFEYSINMDKNKMIIMGGRDDFISPYSLKEFSEKNWNINLKFYQNRNHGFVLKPSSKKEIQNIIYNFINE